MSGSYAPLWPLVEPAIAARQPANYRPSTSNGWHLYHSPLRVDRNPSFSVKPDSASHPGGFTDHTTGDKGSMADLARLMDISPHVSKHDAPARPDAMPRTLAGFCDARQLDKARLHSLFDVQEIRHRNRPALRYPTPLGIDRIKYLDGQRPKYCWAKTGGRRHWYGLTQAMALDGETLYIVNGEPSVWACILAGVPAICLCGGEGSSPAPELIAELHEVISGPRS